MNELAVEVALERLEAVTKERDELRAKLERAENRLGNWSVQHELDDMTQERNGLKAKLKRAEADCGKLRNVVQHLYNWKSHLMSDRKYSCLLIDAAEALSTQCGVGLLEKVKRYEESLKRIYNFPVHSEPVGGAYEMQDIAHEALAETEAK